MRLNGQSTSGREARYVSNFAIGHLGEFDPKHVDDPVVANKVWRYRSLVDLDLVDNPGLTRPSWWGVSGVIDYSLNNGTDWTGQRVINRSQNLRNGYLHNHEVGGIVYDAGETDANQMWKMVWLSSYLNDDLGPTSWIDITKTAIMMRTAPSPDGPWSGAIKLMTGASYSAGTVDVYRGAALFTDAAAVVVEPGICAHPTSGFYMVYTAHAGGVAANDRLKLCRIWKNAGVWTKTDLGQPMLFPNDPTYFQLLSSTFPATFPRWSATVSFDAADICLIGATYHLIFTPKDVNHRYMGFMSVPFTNINTATLSRDGSSNLVPGVPLDYSASHNGAATYSSKSTGTGISFSYLPGIPFQIIDSGSPIP
jgi:hypothetical protein